MIHYSSNSLADKIATPMAPHHCIVHTKFTPMMSIHKFTSILLKTTYIIEARTREKQPATFASPTVCGSSDTVDWNQSSYKHHNSENSTGNMESLVQSMYETHPVHNANFKREKICFLVLSFQQRLHVKQPSIEEEQHNLANAHTQNMIPFN
jgi:hypothetical protein